MKLVCQITDIPNYQAKAYSLGADESIIIVRWDLKVYAYRNRCPHAGVELQWDDGRFMSYDGSQLQCSTHGALFNVDNGLCTWGPCKGRSLSAVEINVENGKVYLD